MATTQNDIDNLRNLLDDLEDGTLEIVDTKRYRRALRLVFQFVERT